MKLDDIVGRARALWQGIPARRRPVLVASVVLTIALLAGWTYFAGRPEFVVLYNRLDAKDASQMVELLESNGTQYRLAANGATILVPSRDVHAARLLLADEGLPNQGTPGFELLDAVSVGATEFERRAAYVRALCGELARTISGISQVESARVHVVLPEQTLFTAQVRPTTAAVFIRHAPGARLDPDQVEGIIHLVSHSVEGLSPESVTVVDEGGRVLSTGLALGQSSSSGRASSNLDTSRRVAADLETSLQRLLEQVLGPGNVVTRVAAELSFDESIVDRRVFQPAGDSDGLVRSVQELTEYFRGGAAGDGGAAGTQGNVPVYQAQVAGESTSTESERTETTKNYELNETQEHTIIAPGALKRLSVSVVVNQELAGADAQRIERLVSAAVGSDSQRNDQIVVTGMPFNVDLAQAVVADVAVAKRRQLIYTAGGAGLGLIAGLVIFLRARRGARSRAQEQVVIAEEVVPELPPADLSRLKLQEELQRLFRQRPQAAAQLIRSWLVEE